MVEVGLKTKDFTLPGDRGSQLHLAKLKGRPVVAYFYPKDDTSGWTAEAKDFSSMIEISTRPARLLSAFRPIR